jgi:polyribonucleotide nucleotidyltransferase
VYRAGGAAPDYGRSVLLTDIQGLEDHLGDMDFKVGAAGARV